MKKQLELLKKQYNVAIARFHKMEEWCETATSEDQEKNFKHIVDVINNCNKLLNEIKKYDEFVTDSEILNGFKEI